MLTFYDSIKKAVRRTNVVANGGGGLFASLKPLTTSGTVGFGQRSEVGLTRPPLSSINQCTVNSNKSDGEKFMQCNETKIITFCTIAD